MTEFRTASSLDDALAALADGFRPVAGGTDLVVAARHGKTPLPEKLISIARLGDLSTIESGPDEVSIGAVVSHHRVMNDPLIVDVCTALADASALVGSPATRNVGTIGGNVMNASPAMDTGAPLVVLDSEVVLRSVRGERIVPIASFWVSPGATVAEADEMCTQIRVRPTSRGAGSAYIRLEYRRAMEIAVVGAASRVVLNPDGSGAVVEASVALTAVAPTILELEGLPDIVVGRQVDESLLADVARLASEQSAPISDLRAGDEYRRHCVGVMARRAMAAASARAEGRHVAVPVNHHAGIGLAR